MKLCVRCTTTRLAAEGKKIENMFGILTVGLLLTALVALNEFQSANALDINSRLGQILNGQCILFCEKGEATGQALLDETPRQCECHYSDGSSEKFNLQNTQAIEKASEIHATRRHDKTTARTNDNDDTTKHADGNTHFNNINRDDTEHSRRQDESYPQENKFHSEDHEVKEKETIDNQRSCQSHCQYRFYGHASFEGKRKTCFCYDNDESALYDTNGNYISEQETHEVNNLADNGRYKQKKQSKKTKVPLIESRDDCVSFCKKRQYKKATFLSKKQICCCLINKSNYANYDLYGKLVKRVL